jgi:hypothetical protein
MPKEVSHMAYVFYFIFPFSLSFVIPLFYNIPHKNMEFTTTHMI